VAFLNHLSFGARVRGGHRRPASAWDISAASAAASSGRTLACRAGHPKDPDALNGMTLGLEARRVIYLTYKSNTAP
jgi:hypothetical protein